MGFKEGDIVILAMANSIIFPTMALALNKLGVTVAPINPMHTPYEMGKFLRLTNAKAIITQPLFVPNIQTALEENSDLNVQIFSDNVPGNTVS